MGKTSRDKGKRGEREVAEILRIHNFDAKRDGRLDDDLAHDVEGYHLEVKRAERWDLHAWLSQAEGDAKGRVPVVVFRRSRDRWRAVIDFERLCALLALERDSC